MSRYKNIIGIRFKMSSKLLETFPFGAKKKSSLYATIYIGMQSDRCSKLENQFGGNVTII